MKTRSLKDLLPDETIAAIVALANAGQRSARDFKPVLEPHRAELEKKGVLVEYLAYVLEHEIANILRGSAR